MSAMQTEAERLHWISRDSAVPVPDLGGPLRRPSGVGVPRPAAPPFPRPRTRPRTGTDPRRGLLAIVLAGAMAAAAASGSIAVAQEQFAVDGTRTQIQHLQGQNRRLVAQLAELQSPQRIESEAVDQLGMQRPAGYAPVAVQPVPPAAVRGAAHTVQVTLPVPNGPAPGGVRSIVRATVSGAQALWRRVRG